MVQELFQFAFIGPGGPEVLVVMLVLLLMFGAKDAPRIFRKLNEIINQIRNTADGFKREVMYGDLAKENPSSDEPPDNTDESGHTEDDYYDYGEDDGGDGEEFQASEEDRDDEPVEVVPEPDAEGESSEGEDDDAQKA